MWVLWPAFLAAAAGQAAVFVLVDPADLKLFGHLVDLPPEVVYTLSFFGLWVLTTASSALTCFLQRSPFEINRCSLGPEERPPDCPKCEAPDSRRAS